MKRGREKATLATAAVKTGGRGPARVTYPGPGWDTAIFETNISRTEVLRVGFFLESLPACRRTVHPSRQKDLDRIKPMKMKDLGAKNGRRGTS